MKKAIEGCLFWLVVIVIITVIIVIIGVVCQKYGVLGFVGLVAFCATVGILIGNVIPNIKDRKKQNQREAQEREEAKRKFEMQREEARRNVEIELKEKESKQRQEYASELKTKFTNTMRQCEVNLINSRGHTLMPEYKSIDKQKKMWNTLDKILLNAENLENTITELKLIELKAITQENITRLEAKEKEICEQAIDCGIVTGEYKYALENLLSKAREIYSYKSEISREEKNIEEEKLDIISKESDLEYRELLQVTLSHPKFKEYSNLVEEQKSIVKNIDQNISALEEVEQIVNQSTSEVKRR